MRAVLITGASTGIGRAAALWLDREGWTVFPCVRKDADAASLAEAGSDRMKPLILDVVDPGHVSAAAARVDEVVGPHGLLGLVNNAGIAGGGPLEFIDEDEVRKVLEVNLFGVMRCTQAFLPALRRGSPGRIVNVSSIGGRWAGPFLAPYHMSKWALEAYSDSLRMELHPHGIEVSVIEPGTISTAIWQKADSTIEGLIGDMEPEVDQHYGDQLRHQAKIIKGRPDQGVSPDVVAAKIAHALTATRPSTRYLVGPDARLISFLRWLLPDRAFDAVIRRGMSRSG